ncbi:hypothetical protein P280DRAFT_508037 [Massarina eburnea CBS 473.64]|uniref:Zn(2)-C6 fungal-type domain-containing protein n=1 Tax=Massarina eburnea CBS 473.64 TaxID=1395130 RepID=A0A6A6RWR8_9PLEO|nr:hypothetical protein P280DRAFT_508037 [Massarina eburnea CBS 473.64]
MADISHSAADVPPTKRLRVGTKSCLECRRRKIRCIFEPRTSVCNSCHLHGAVCRPQKGAPIPGEPAGASDRTVERTETQVLHDRIAHLEGLMTQMLQNQENSTTQSTDAPHFRTPTYRISPQQGLNEVVNTNISNIPLTTPWKEDMLMPASSLGTEQTTNVRLNRPIPLPPPVLPTLADLAILFDHSEKHWPLWPTPTFDVTRLQKLIMGQREFNADTAHGNTQSGDDIVIAKRFLWIALCLTHYPLDRIRALNLPGARQQLLDQYTEYASAILGIYADTAGGIDELECYAIHWKIHFDIGKPRRAWQILRQGVTAAIQLGLHQPEFHKDDHEIAMWTSLWQSERQMSCMLGLPSCTTNGHPGTQLGDESTIEPTTIVHHKLSLVAGEINRRDLTDLKISYASIIRIEREIEAVRQFLPSLSADQSFAAYREAVSVNIRLHSISKLLNMPYMFQGVKSSRFRYNFNRAVDASRHSIKIWTNFRKLYDEYRSDCLDFEMFNSAIVILLAILSYRRDTKMPQDQTPDWTLICAASHSLRHTVSKLDSCVARQCADTLDILIATCHEYAFLQEDFTVTIPYFGRVKLQTPSSQHTPSTTQTSSPKIKQEQSLSNLSLEYDSPRIEFSSQTHGTFGQIAPMPFSSGDELGVDWFRISVDESSYDWFQEYPCYEEV